MLMIGAQHPVREAVASLATYHNSKSDLLCAVRDAYADHNIELGDVNLLGDDGYATVELRPAQTAHIVCDCCEAEHARKAFNNHAVISWYTMQSGRVELTTYVS
jgi:hypothetical protein